MDLVDQHDLFAATDLWRPSTFSYNGPQQQDTLFAPLELDLPSIKLSNPYAPTTDLAHDLRLPDLDAFAFGPLEDLELPEESAVSSESEHVAPDEDGKSEDIWSVAIDLGPLDSDVKFYTWEKFARPEQEEPCSAYISEAGPEAFDAAILVQSESAGAPGKAGNVLRSDVLLRSLYSLGLGQSSVLFTYDEEKGTFRPLVEDIRMSGCTTISTRDFVRQLLQYGNAVVHLRRFADKTYTSRSSFPARVAFANSIAAVISALESHLSTRASTIKSVLQLQQLFERPRRTLLQVMDVMNAVKSATTNEQLVSIVFGRAQQYEQEDSWLRTVMLSLLSRVASPWLEVVAEWVGLRQEQGLYFQSHLTAGTFVTLDASSEEQPGNGYLDRFLYDADKMPTCISEDDGRMIFETGKSIRFLRSHHPNHPLSQPSSAAHQPVTLEWNFEWHDMERIAEKARNYELRLAEAIREYTRPTIPFHSPKSQQANHQLERTLQAPGKAVDLSRELLDLSQQFDKPPSSLLDLPDELYQSILLSLDIAVENQDSELWTLAPPIALTSSLSLTPLLAAQARQVNAACIRLFFRSHELRHHLALQRSFSLLGDGVFIARLTSSLFNPEVSTAEHHRGVMRSGVDMGLRLGTRRTWPPASSELRLALMGILSDSYRNTHGLEKRQDAAQSTDLPGNLSFAIRQLSSEDADRVMDPQSIYALDFLRLQYTPPSPLQSVITPLSLEKYDTIFKFLLRLLRLLFVVSNLPRKFPSQPSRLFRLQAHHFVTSCSAYFFDTGVRDTWDAFEFYLDDIEARLKQEDDLASYGARVKEGIDNIRVAHEACLDRILFVLLLRKRQEKIMVLLEEIFETVLKFAGLCGEGAEAGRHELRQLHDKFNNDVSVFLEVCRGLVGKKGYGKRKGGSTVQEENTLERLVLSLEMSGWYSARSLLL